MPSHPLPVRAAIALVALAGAALVPSVASSAPGDVTARVEIPGGRKLFLRCRGRGAPTVILEAGLRNTGGIWTIPAPGGGPGVLAGVAAFTRVCAYDRPGTTLGATGRSLSDPVQGPRTAREIAADLRALLMAARVPGPYVLAGHSTGGTFVRVFAGDNPGRVAGLVLVDAFTEGTKAALTPAQWRAYRALNTVAPAPLRGYRDLELIDFDRSFAQAARARIPARIPVSVLSKGRPFDLPGVPAGLTAAIERAWIAGQDDLARRLVPGATRTVATASGHYIPAEQPSVVIREIRAVVEAARRAGRR